MGARLKEAVMHADIVETLICTAELDRMARTLGKHARTDEARTALRHANALVGQTLTSLQASMQQQKAAALRESHLRRAYGAYGPQTHGSKE
jgi:hypothetical protein